MEQKTPSAVNVVERYRRGRTPEQMEREARALIAESDELHGQGVQDSNALIELRNRMALLERKMREREDRIVRVAIRYSEVRRAIREEKARRRVV